MSKSSFNSSSILVIGVAILAWFIYLRGVQQDLPYYAHQDETVFVKAVSNMVLRDTLNPGWFGNPGSTIIYPIFFLGNLWQIISPTDQLLYPHLPFAKELYDVWTPYYLLGRFITAGYGVLSVILIYKLGQQLFTPLTGLVGALLYVFYPLVVNYTQLVRTDSATLFWTLLSLYTLFNLLHYPSTLRHLMAGSVIGLAIATKYYLGVLALMLLIVNLLIIWRDGFRLSMKKVLPAFIGFTAVGATFSLSTPFFFIDFSTALHNLIWEARSSHPAFESLSPLGNFIWYVTQAIPTVISPIQAGLVVVAIGMLCYKLQIRQLLLLSFALIFLVAISQSGLHWNRWLFPILPILALLAAFTLITVSHWLGETLGWGKISSYAVVIIATLLLSYSHIVTINRFEDYRVRPDTRVLAGMWLLEHTDTDSFVIYEEYSAPIAQNSFKSQLVWSTATSGYSLEDASQLGIDFIVVSSRIYNSYIRNPQRFPEEAAFYEYLFEQVELAHEFKPLQTQRGPTIKIYRLTSS